MESWLPEFETFINMPKTPGQLAYIYPLIHWIHILLSSDHGIPQHAYEISCYLDQFSSQAYTAYTLILNPYRIPSSHRCRWQLSRRIHQGSQQVRLHDREPVRGLVHRQAALPATRWPPTRYDSLRLLRVRARQSVLSSGLLDWWQ